MYAREIDSQEEFEDKVDALAHVGCLAHRLLDFFKHQRTEASKSLLRWKDSVFNPLCLLEEAIRLYLRRTSTIKNVSLQQDDGQDVDGVDDDDGEEKTKEEKSCDDLVAEKKKKMFKQLTRDLVTTLKQFSSFLATEDEEDHQSDRDHTRTTTLSNHQRKLD